MDTATVWCPSCGSEYVAGSLQCSDCRVALVTYRPDSSAPGTSDDSLVELGDYPRLAAQILRRRLETAGVNVMVEWTGPGAHATGTIVVNEDQAEFASAVINEVDVDDEVPDTSPEAYVARIDEHLAAVSALLEELRTVLEGEVETQ